MSRKAVRLCCSYSYWMKDISVYLAIIVLCMLFLKQLGLCNAWKGATNQWGYAQVGVENLFDTEARLVIIRSYNSAGLEEQIARTALWSYLPSVRRGDVIVLPSTFWIAGGLPSALRFAESLVEALETPTAL